MGSFVPHPTFLALSFGLGLSLAACGSEPQGEPLGQEGAHEHGVADVSIVVDGPEATVSFRAPSGDLYGAEGRELAGDELERAQAALGQLESNLVAMLGIPGTSECQVTETTWAEAGAEVMDPRGDPATSEEDDGEHEHEHEHEHEGEEGGGHSDVVADFRIECAAPLAGTTLELGFPEHFEAIEKIDLQAVSEERQYGRRVPAEGTRIQL